MSFIKLSELTQPLYVEHVESESTDHEDLKINADSSFTEKICSYLFSTSKKSELNILSAGSIGVGFYCLDFVFKQCGLILGIILFLATGLTFAFFKDVIMWGLVSTHETSLMRMVYHLYGKRTRKMMKMCAGVLIFGLLCSHQAFAASFFQDILKSKD